MPILLLNLPCDIFRHYVVGLYAVPVLGASSGHMQFNDEPFFRGYKPNAAK